MTNPFEKGEINILADDAGPNGGATIIGGNRGSRALYWFVCAVWVILNFLCNTKEKVVFESDSSRCSHKKWWEIKDDAK